ncbi:MAG: hypothetical protein IKH75_13255 [Ruminococcus sp.]|nr:hypothetical protein [Ruminococcus sp.]
MVLENHYIFIPKKKESKPKPQKNKDGVTDISFPTTIKDYILKTFSPVTEVPNFNIYKNEYNVQININNELHDITIRTYSVGKCTYVSVTACEENEKQAVHCLEEIQSKIYDSDVEKDYTILVSYDSISEHYCNKIYPKLNMLERNLRRLFFNIYTLNFDADFLKTFPEEIRNKVYKAIPKKGGVVKTNEERTKLFFYSMNYGDIQRILFDKTWTDCDEKKKLEFLSSNPDLTQLTDEELRNSFNRYTPQSDWDRFFRDKIDDDVNAESLIDSIRVFRNNIAHCKFFNSQAYTECNEKIQELNDAIIKAIKITEEKDFSEKNHKALQESIIRMREVFTNISNTIKDIFKMYYDNKDENYNSLKNIADYLKNISKNSLDESEHNIDDNDENEENEDKNEDKSQEDDTEDESNSNDK